MALAWALRDGETFGDYEILGALGRGGMGVVYRARDRRSGTTVALKLLLGGAGDERFLARFRREADLARRVRDENVVAVHDAGEVGPTPFIAFELVTGGSLSDELKKRGALDWRDAATLGIGIARGLAAIHAQGLVHRDLKPGNVLLDEQGRPKVSDFGLARVIRDTASGVAPQDLTKTGQLLGTLDYMAPEQVDRAREADGRADLYALGATLYHALVGQAPFDGVGIEVITKHLLEPAPKVRTKTPAVPVALEELVATLLAKKPADRPSSALAVVERLEAILAGGTGTSRRVPRGLVAVVSLLALIVVVALVVPRGGDAPVVPVAPVPAPVSPTPVPQGERPALHLPAGLSLGGPGEYIHDATGIVLVHVPAGEFEMGRATTDSRPNEKPVHPVELSGYFLGKYEVTGAEFAAFVKATGMKTTAETGGVGRTWFLDVDGVPTFVDHTVRNWRKPEGDEDAPRDHPVTCVTWEDATAFCRWAGLRLPTEAEWERAAAWDRSGKKARARRFAWGDDEPRGARAKRVANVADAAFKARWPKPVETELWANQNPIQRTDPALVPGLPLFESYDDGFATTAPARSFPEGASPVGALHMTGNVLEWCQDAYDERFYARSPRTDPVCESGPEPGVRVVRGGGWGSGPRVSRCSFRGFADGVERLGALGFRVALSARAK